jgi:hypothetical protein
MTDPLFLLGRTREASLDSPSFSVSSGNVLRTVDAVQHAYNHHRCARWIIVDSSAIALLASAVQAHSTWHRVLFLEPARTPRRELLHALFRVVIAPDDGVRLLSRPELKEVLASARSEDLFIGGVADLDDRVVVLYRGNFERLIVPFEWFKPRSKDRVPDFGAFSVTDFGQTIQLGEYEIAADALLYEFDVTARRRMRERAVNEDSSFGAALRRLRLHRGLERSAFAPLHEKTIARIERGEVEEPHDETLTLIAKRLGVKPDEIKTY